MLHGKWDPFLRAQNSNIECGLYHSGLSREKLDQAMEQWAANSKNHFVMFCTEGFGMGVDAPNVETVVVAGGSHSLVDFWQVAGRGGRDGSRCLVKVFYHRSHLISAGAFENYEVECDVQRNGDFQAWAELKRPLCRRRELESFISGEAAASLKTCREENSELHCALCDLCKGKGVEISQVISAPTSVINGSGGVCSARPPFWPASSNGARGNGRVVVLGKGLGTKRQMIQTTFSCSGRGPSERHCKKLRTVKMSIEHLRRSCVGFEGTCAGCVVTAKLQGRRIVRSSVSHVSVSGTCFRGRCVRCMQVGHDVRACSVMPRPNKNRVACRECFLHYAGGERVHSSEEFGQKSCPFRVLVHLAMYCWGSTGPLHLSLLSEAKMHGLESGEINAADFSLWLCTDRCGKLPGILAINDWIKTQFPVE